MSIEQKKSASSRPLLRHRGKAILLAAFVALLLLVLLWDWNWFKPVVESRASTALGREVTIGNLDVKLGRRPWVIIDGLAVANPEDWPDRGKNFGGAERIRLRVDGWQLIKGRIVMPNLAIERPRVDLRGDAEGRGNWVFDLPESDPDDKGDPMEIGALSIVNGEISVIDAVRKADFRILLHTEEATPGQESQLIANARGTYAGQPVVGSLRGSAVLSLRDPANPYEVDLRAQNGPTRVRLHGTLIDPLHFGGADVRLDLRGNDLAALFPLTGIPLPPTPPYQLSGSLDYVDNKVRFRNFDGRVGGSDLSGDLSYEPRRKNADERPVIRADLTSKKIVLADLGGFIGAPPGEENAPTQSGQQRAEHARQEAKATVLPDRPINLPKLRFADFHVRYKGQRIETENLPLDNIVAKLDIVNGKVDLRPLSFGIGNGQIAMNVALDGRDDQVHAVADIDFRRVELARIMREVPIFGGAGTIGGKARIDTTGNSLKTMLARGDGELQLFMADGNLSATLVDLAGIDLGNALLSALGIPGRTDLRCMIADFDLEDGQLGTRTLLLDTKEANVFGSGRIDLKNERLDYKLETDPKRPNIASLPTPIRIRGTFKDPDIDVESRPLTVRGAAAVALGVLLGPVAALIPTIQLGLGEDNDCVALLKSVDAPRTAVNKAARAADQEAKEKN